MSKRNVAFIKPDEPLFLKKLKQQIGYREGPTVDTKREHQPFPDADDSDEDKLDDQPTVVVLNPGDLSAEQVEIEKKKEAEAPADLKQKVIFKPSKKNIKSLEDVSTSNGDFEKSSKKSKNQSKPSTKLLSFNDEDEE